MVHEDAWRWRSHVLSQQMSGLSQAAYCRIWRIPLYVFVAWRRRWWAAQLAPLELVPVSPRDG
ncbi:MAG: hypothetical protein KF823_00510 [Xanthomonadales bacterium]|nr:hypothetical protein [Xanthomonadales bacterium]